ncbi:MAG: formylglycine-generating enzyme family protein [Lentisphaeria bacterium]|nr:formylglycine-generating enzyme family protein [Lentisphaeria bacterium]
MKNKRSDATISPKKPAGFGLSRKKRFRWFLRIALIVVLLQVSINYITTKKPDFVAKSTSAKINIYSGGPIVLGTSALKFVGLKEVSSRLANLEKLAKGSDEAQKLQRKTVEEMNLPLTVENSIGMTFRLIPPGIFMMGSPDTEKGRKAFFNRGIDVEGEHRESISSPFYVGSHEVTTDQWKAVMKTIPTSNGRANYRPQDGKNIPMTEVTWGDAVRFCLALTKLEGLPRGSYRLLKEIEWEYACRAGSEGPFCFESMKDINYFVTYKGNSVESGVKVGGRLPNAWGLFNMHGNVMEWCNDYYIDYFTGKMPKKDKNMRSVRGGSWHESWQNCRSANRARLGSTSHGNVLGFRIVRSIVKELVDLKTVEKAVIKNIKREKPNE